MNDFVQQALSKALPIYLEMERLVFEVEEKENEK